MDHYDDDNYNDGFDEQTLASRMQTHLWRRLFSYTLPHKRDLAALAGFSFLTAIAEVTFPLITKWVVDDIQANGGDADLVLWALLYLVCTAVLAVSVAGFVAIAGKIRAFLSHDIREEAFGNLQRLSFSFYDHRPVGWLMARMTSDCERLSNILAWGFMDFIWGATTMVGIAGAMVVMQWDLALVVLAILPVLYWVSVKFRRSILTSARQVRRANSRITGSYNEAIMGVLTSKAFVRERENLGEFQGLTGTMYRASVTNMTLSAIYLPIVTTLASLSMGLVLLVGGMDVYVAPLMVGTLVAFLAYARHFFEPVETMGYWFAEMQMAQASAERVLSLIDAEATIRDSDDVLEAISAQRAAPEREHVAFDGGPARISRIELKNVGFAYESGARYSRTST